MKIVEVRNQYTGNGELKDLTWNNHSMTHKNTVIFKQNMDSQNNDESDKHKGIISIGLNETLSNYIGIYSLKLYLNQDNEICLCEMTDSGENLIKFANADAVAEYINYLNKLGIYCKLYNTEIKISRNDEYASHEIIEEISGFYPSPIGTLHKEKNNFDNFVETNKEKFKIIEHTSSYFTENNFKLFSNSKEIETLTEDRIEDLILNKFSNMSFEEISSSGLSMYEYRKIIGMQYKNIELTENEIEAMSAYKHMGFKKINGFLRGDLSWLNEKQLITFFSDEIEETIDYALTISRLQEKFALKKDTIMLRTDNRKDISENSKITYDNFVSTSAMSNLTEYKLEGISKGKYMYINVPKGTPILPTDLVMEKKTQLGMGINANNTEHDEAEWLLPMCEIENDDECIDKKGRTIVNSKITKVQNPIEIILTRLKDFENEIVKCSGHNKFNELIAKVQAMKLQDTKREIFTEQEIGKSTINTITQIKDNALDRVEIDQQEQNQEQAVLK